MTPSRWKKIGELFKAARTLKREEQIPFLFEHCRTERSVFDQVLSLLESEKESGLLDQTVAADSLGPCRVFADRFRILRHVGRGGMGDVFEAEDLRLHERVALKTIRPEIVSDTRVLNRFEREIQLAKRVTHPNICRIYDLGVHRFEDGTELLFFTMEFLDGETLASRITRGPMSGPEALPFIEDMVAALSAAHMADIAHRDFKSANVMIVRDKTREKAIVTDFGLACAIRDRVEGSVLSGEPLLGTVAYMAPEQVRGERVNASADVYALGVVMYEMVTGRCPFEGDSAVSVALKHLNERPPRPSKFAPQVDPNLEAVILRCLKKAPGERFPTAEAVKAGLFQGWRKPSSALTRRTFYAVAVSIGGLLVLALAGAIERWDALEFRPFSGPKRVAVLPFKNIGSEASNEAFCQGVTEMLTSRLTQLEQFQRTLSVIPASELRSDGMLTVLDAHRQFGANLAITGSVQRSGAGVRVTTNIIDARDARELRQIDSKDSFVLMDELPIMEDVVLKDATDLLNFELNPEARKTLAEGRTSSPGAYGYYVQGYGYLHSGSPTLDQAITEFRHALEQDGSYALAYAGLGESYWRKYVRTRDPRWIGQAWNECRRAVAINPRLAPPHATLAMLYSGTGKFEEAIRECNLALSIDPRNRDAYAQKAQTLESMGQISEAETVLKKTVELKPDSWEGYFQLGSFYKKYGRYRDAEDPMQRVVDLLPDSSIGYANLGVVYYFEGLSKKAEGLFLTSLRLKATPETYSNLATLYFFQGRFAEAAAIYEQQATAEQSDYTIWGNLGDACRWSPGLRAKASSAYGEAIALAEQALKVNPRDSDHAEKETASKHFRHARSKEKRRALSLQDLDDNEARYATCFGLLPTRPSDRSAWVYREFSFPNRENYSHIQRFLCCEWANL